MEGTARFRGEEAARSTARGDGGSSGSARTPPVRARRKSGAVMLEEGFPSRRSPRARACGLSTLGAWVRRYRGPGERRTGGRRGRGARDQ